MSLPAPQPEVLRVAVIGAGAFGRNHLRVYRELEAAGAAVELTAVVDSDPAALAAAAQQFDIPGSRCFASVEACLAANRDSSGSSGPPGFARGAARGQDSSRLAAASVCVPTIHHATAAAPLLAAGLDLLIEKPLAATLEDADRILAVARQHQRIVQPGHLERFNPAVAAARAHLHRPMFFEAHRLSIFTPRSLDVDVVLDLMIHDLDIVLSLVGSPVREVRAVGLPVLSRKVDIANVRIEFENGCIANFTASRVSTERVRKLRFFQPRQYLSIDFARQDLLIIDAPERDAPDGGAAKLNPAAMMDPAEAAGLLAQAALLSDDAVPGGAQPRHPSAGLSLQKISVAQGEPLRLEIEGFLNAVRTRGAPPVTAEEGRAALALALEINQVIAEHAERSGLYALSS